MPAIDTGLAAWLKDESLFTSVAPGGVAWGERGIAVDFLTPANAKVDATIEGTRIAAFMGSPVVKDNVEVIGSRRDLLGKVVALTGDRLGYSATAKNVFVAGVSETNANTTVLSVLRKLA